MQPPIDGRTFDPDHEWGIYEDPDGNWFAQRMSPAGIPQSSMRFKHELDVLNWLKTTQAWLRGTPDEVNTLIRHPQLGPARRMPLDWDVHFGPDEYHNPGTHGGDDDDYDSYGDEDWEDVGERPALPRPIDLSGISTARDGDLDLGGTTPSGRMRGEPRQIAPPNYGTSRRQNPGRRGRGRTGF